MKFKSNTPYSQEYIETYIRDNFNTKTIVDIAKDLQIHSTTVGRINKKLNLGPKANIIRHELGERKRKYQPNDDIFDNINANSAYILGYLVTDGHIDKSEKAIYLGLSLKDKDILEKIRDEISPNSPLSLLSNKILRLRITSHKIYNYLLGIGFTNRKTCNEPLILDNIPQEFHYDYLRGVIDGDGCVYYHRFVGGKNGGCYKSALSISLGHREFLEDINIRLYKNIGKIKTIHHPDSKISTKQYYDLRISSIPKIVSVLDQVYNNIEDKLYLDRKYQKYLLIKARYNEYFLPKGDK